VTLELSQAVTLCLAHSANAHNVGRAVGIMWAESKLDPAAVCHNVRNLRTMKVVCGTPGAPGYSGLLSTDRGIWQINDHWHKEVSDAQAFDPTQATIAAYRISAGFTDFHQWATAPLLTSNPSVERIVSLATEEAKQQLAGEKGPSPITAATAAVGGTLYGAGKAAGAAASGAVHGTISLGEFLANITDPKVWTRVLEVIGGAACLLVGAFMLDRSLTSQLIGTAASNVVGGAASKVGASAVARGSLRLA